MSLYAFSQSSRSTPQLAMDSCPKSSSLENSQSQCFSRALSRNDNFSHTSFQDFQNPTRTAPVYKEPVPDEIAWKQDEILSKVCFIFFYPRFGYTMD